MHQLPAAGESNWLQTKAVMEPTRLHNRFWRILLLPLCVFALSGMVKPLPSTAETHVALPGESCRVPPLDAWKDRPEEWVWSQICEGKKADFNARYRPTLDPKSPDGWTNDRKLGSTFLETILLHEPFRSALTRNGVRIIGAWFLEPVDLANAKIEQQLWLDNSRFESSVDLSRLKSPGVVSLQGSKLTGTLDMNSIEVGGDLFMLGRAEFGNVVLRSAKIGGQLSMIGSKFTGKLNMDKLQVGTSLLMRGGAEFGNVVLRSAKIGGQLSMTGSKFAGKLNVDSMEVGGSLFMRGGEFAEPVRLIFTKIGSNLDLSGAKLAGLDLTGTRIEGELRLGSHEHDATDWRDGSELTLRNTVVGALQDRRGAWPERLELGGFRYSRLGGLAGGGTTDMADRDAQWFVDWLAKDKSYSPQPYEELASVLRKAGQYDKANDILYAGRERERAGAKWVKWFGLTLLKYSIGYGYGYGYFLSLIWIGVLVVTGVVFLKATDESQRLGMPYGIAYSLDMLLPIVRLREWHYHNVDLKPPARYYFYFHKLMGYVLASFLIAGLSGLTK